MGYAFRCKNCGRLEASAYAGERAVPARCSVCGAGVRFSPDGIKTYDEDNWVVLAELPSGELKVILDYHKLDPSDIDAHVPAGPGDPTHEPAHLHAVVEEGVGAEDTI